MFFPDCSTVIEGAPRLVVSAPRLVALAPMCFQACCSRSLVCRWRPGVLPDAPKVLSGTPRCFQSYHNHSHGTLVQVVNDPRYSEGRPECPPKVWYSPEINSFKFTLHILSGTPGGFQWLKYILLMYLYYILFQFIVRSQMAKVVNLSYPLLKF